MGDTIRFWELDAVRGIAVAMMILFHLLFDLNYFGFAEIELYEGGFLLFQRSIAFLFLTIVGISLSISNDKHNSSTYFILRGLKLAAVAALITVTTFIYPNNGFIVFGIIHLIVLSVLLAPVYIRHTQMNLVIGILLLVAGIVAPLPQISEPWLLWLGVKFPGFSSLDYYPLYPWFGLVLLGTYLGKKLYAPHGKRLFNFTKPDSMAIEACEWLGRNALAIYLVHQPILIALLSAYSLLS